MLKKTNYSAWKRVVINALISKHKTVFIDGRLPKTPLSDPNEENWITCNSMVISWILNSLSKELHDNVVSHNTTHAMWKQLEERFSQGSNPRNQEVK